MLCLLYNNDWKYDNRYLCLLPKIIGKACLYALYLRKLLCVSFYCEYWDLSNALSFLLSIWWMILNEIWVCTIHAVLDNLHFLMMYYYSCSYILLGLVVTILFRFASVFTREIKLIIFLSYNILIRFSYEDYSGFLKEARWFSSLSITWNNLCIGFTFP